MTSDGQCPVDFGLLLYIERPKDNYEGWEVKWGPLFQTEFGKIQLNANLLFQRNYDAAAANDLLFMYQWQVKYRWKPQFEFGAQGCSEMGTVDRWSPQDDRIYKHGPAVSGMFAFGTGVGMKYQAA